MLIILLSALIIWACKQDHKEPTIQEEHITTLYFIRHAEKDRSDPDDIDPELNQEGLGRAMRWAEILGPVDLDAIYITDFKRTSMTAAPTSVKREISPQYYDPKAIIIEDFLKENLGRNVLVVGHADSTPQFVNALLGEQKYEPMDDYDYSSLFIIRIINGKASDIRLQMD